MTLQLDAEHLSRLIGIAYDADLQPADWRSFAERARQTMSASLAMVMYFDHREPQRSFVVGAGDMAPEFEEEFLRLGRSRYGDDEDFLWVDVRDLPPGAIRRNIDIHPLEECRTTRIYQRLGAPWKLEHVMMGVVTNGIGASAYFSLARPPSAMPFSPADKSLVSRSLLSHMRRSLDLRRALRESESRNALLHAVADLSPYAIIAYDRAARPVLVNRRAEELFRTCTALNFRNGVLRSRQPSIQAQLDWSLGAALDLADGNEGAAPPAVPVPIAPGEYLDVVFAPMTVGASIPGIPATAACVVLIRERGRRRGSPAITPAVIRAYGLTPAEIRLGEALCRGQTLPQAADALGISRNTAKTHLARIFDKTGVRSQIALLRLLAFGPDEHVDEKVRQ